jgi:hypothetical protein
MKDRQIIEVEGEKIIEYTGDSITYKTKDDRTITLIGEIDEHYEILRYWKDKFGDDNIMTETINACLNVFVIEEARRKQLWVEYIKLNFFKRIITLFPPHI